IVRRLPPAPCESAVDAGAGRGGSSPRPLTALLGSLLGARARRDRLGRRGAPSRMVRALVRLVSPVSMVPLAIVRSNRAAVGGRACRDSGCGGGDRSRRPTRQPAGRRSAGGRYVCGSSGAP